jgi:hypothetical protein
MSWRNIADHNLGGLLTRMMYGVEKTAAIVDEAGDEKGGADSGEDGRINAALPEPHGIAPESRANRRAPG